MKERLEIIIINKIGQASQRGLAHPFVSKGGLEFSPFEKAEQLWGIFNEYNLYRRKMYKDKLNEEKTKNGIKKTQDLFKALPRNMNMRDVLRLQLSQDPLIQRLEGRISQLWQNPQVRNIVTTKVTESIRERQPYQPSLKRYDQLRTKAGNLEEEHFDLLRNEFLMRQMTPTLRRIDMAENQFAFRQARGEITSLEHPQGNISKAGSELAALTANNRLNDYHRQFRESGIILTPTRQALLDRVLIKTAAGTWMQLIGETGTGKTTFAKRTSWILNGEPAQYASGERWGDVRALIGSKTMEGDKVYFDFGPLTVALTGCQNSLEMEKVIRTGRDVSGKLLILDELNKFDQDALFGALKVAATLRPGEFFNYKELPGVKLQMARKGVAVIATMNPATVRYERKELDPALDRLFYDGKEKVEYPPMSAQDPELYEIFLAILMDDHDRIRVSESELAPSFREATDQAAGIIRREMDPDRLKHGVLYRFALAAAEIHKSFTQKENVAKTAIDEGFLEKNVLEMEILVKWINGYSREVEGGDSLTSYLEKKLHDFYQNIDMVNDKAIFERIFTYFGFNMVSPQQTTKPNYVPLTPIEIGYLTPRTPREVRKIGETGVPKTRIYIDSETGQEIEYLPVPWEAKPGRFVNSGETFEDDSKSYRYLGINSKTKQLVIISNEAPAKTGRNILGIRR